MKSKLMTMFAVILMSFNANASLIPIDLNGWDLVRYVSADNAGWHPATDNLAGTDVYSLNNGTFSINFENTVADWDQIMLATGDGIHWMIFNKDQLQITGSNVYMTVLSSSISNTPYQVRFYNRPGNSEDPWLSYNDHFFGGANWRNDSASHSMLYGEGFNG
jgi:hypothetical protein